jgi:hypothetical protein
MSNHTPADTLTPSKPAGESAPRGAMLPQMLNERVKPREKKSDKSADEFLVGLAKKIAAEGEGHQRQKAQLRDFCERIYAGGYGAYGKYNYQGRWEQAASTSRLFPNSRFFFNANNLKSQAESALTRIDVTAKSGSEDKKGGAEFGGYIVEEGQGRLYTSHFRQTEWLRAMFHGEAYRYSRWDVRAEGCYERVPVQQPGEEQLSGSFMCAGCGAEGSEDEAAEAGGCPDCGKPATIIPGQSVPVTSYSFERKSTGNFVTCSVDPLEMKRERGKSLPESRFLERRRLVHISELEEAYPDIQIPAASDVKSPGLQVLRSLDTINPLGGTSYASEKPDEDCREYVQVWFQPRAYADYTFDRDTKLGAGVTVPANTRLGDVFKSGLYLALCGDMILDGQDEDFRDHWTHFCYYTTTDGSGKGVIDGAFLGKSENELSSLLMEWAMRDAAGWGAYNSDLFDGDVPPGTPGHYVPVRLPDGVKVSDIVEQFTGNSIGAGVERLLAFMVESGSYSMGSFPETAGGTGGDTKTYGGLLTQIEQGNSNQRPMLANKAECDRQTAYLWLKLCQKYMTGERYAQFGRFGQAEGKWFKAADVLADFDLSFEKDSYMPQTAAQTRARESAFTEQAQPLVDALIALDPAHPMYSRIQGYLASLETTYGITIEQDTTKQDTRRAQIKLEKFKAACEYVGDGGMAVAPDFQIDPQTGQPVIDPATNQPIPNPNAGQPVPDPEALNAILNLVPYKPEIDGPGAKVQLDFFRSAVLALDDDDEASPLLVEVICAEMQRLKQADVSTGAEQTAMQIGKQGPALAMQQQQQAQQQESQAEGEQMNAQREDQRRAEDTAVESQKREQDFGEKEAQRSHEAGLADAQMRHEQNLARMKQPRA